ncbi:MAG: hypothetical protein AAGK22_24595 [Acidobacteriota bacterium]
MTNVTTPAMRHTIIRSRFCTGRPARKKTNSAASEPMNTATAKPTVFATAARHPSSFSRGSRDANIVVVAVLIHSVKTRLTPSVSHSSRQVHRDPIRKIVSAPAMSR